MIVDLGANFTFNHNVNYSFDFGIRYSMFKNINASDWSNWDSVENEEGFDDLIGNKLDADYKAYYLGVSWYFPNVVNNKKKYNRGRMI